MGNEFLRSIERLIQKDPGRRGLSAVPNRNLLTESAGGLEGSVAAIADHPAPSVAIVTGFMIPTVDPPTGETDGPPGAYFLAEALDRVGIPTLLISDSAGLASLYYAATQRPLTRCALLNVDVGRPMTFEAAGLETLTHLIAIERSGPSYDLPEIPFDYRNRNLTMRGRDITPWTAGLHGLFESAGNRATIGIGDGGNEIGMGKISRDVLIRNVAGADLTACRIAVDHLIVAGVSNWGAWALAAGILQRRGVGSLGMFDADRERTMLEGMVREAPLVDGVTGQFEATVDGLDFDEYIRPLVEMGRLLEQS